MDKYASLKLVLISPTWAGSDRDGGGGENDTNSFQKNVQIALWLEMCSYDVKIISKEHVRVKRDKPNG